MWQKVSLEKFPLVPGLPRPLLLFVNFIKICKGCGNIEALFRKGWYN